MIRALILGAMVATATPALADQRDQLEATVQRRLDIAGFSHVDAASLTNRQLSALFFRLRGNPLQIGGLRSMNTRTRVELILDLDGYALRD